MKTLSFIIYFLCLSGLTFSQGLNLPYYTGFDSPTERAGWREYRTGFNSTFSWGNNGVLSHDYNVGGNSSDTVVDWYVSPPLNITSSTRISMKVRTGGFSSPTPNNCEIWIGTKDQNPVTGNFTLFANISYMSPQYTWLDTSFNISTLSDSVYIAYKYTTIGAYWMTYGIDSITVDNIVGIEENNNFSFSVFPSPLVNKATIQFSKRIINSEISIYSITGHKVKELKNINGESYNLNVNNLKKGIYILVLKDPNGILATKKIVVL